MSKYLDKEGLKIVFDIIKSDLDDKADVSVLEQLLFRLDNLEKDVYFKYHPNLKGSFTNNSTPAQRYVYINGDQIFYDDINFTDYISTALLKVTNTTTSSMFSPQIKTLYCDLNANLNGLSYMFYNCSNLTTLTFGDNFNTENIRSMEYTFTNCYNLTTLTFGDKFNTEMVTSMFSTFNNCTSLKSLNLSTFKIDNVKNMSGTFYYCNKLESLELSNWNFENVTNTSNMFSLCWALTTVTGTISNIKVALDLKSCPLTKESALVFLKGLAPIESTQTLTLKKSTYDLFTAEELAPYSELGWTIIGSESL